MREDISNASLKDCYAILSLKEKGLSAEAKYFLIRVLFNYGRSNVNATVETLEKQIGMSDAVLKKTRDLLLEQNYLTRSLVHSSVNDGSMRGRPREGFVVSDSMIAKLDKIINEQKGLSKVMLAHTHRVAKLLFWKVDDGRLFGNPPFFNRS